MKVLLRFLCGLLFSLPAHGHIGSPNIFFDGQAGPHAVRVIIRPPATLPGVAQVDVRVADEEATGVSIQAAPWEAGDQTAPAPVLATPVAGTPGLFHAPIWLFTKGSYRVRVTAESPRGRGTVSIPLNSAATSPPAMPRATGFILASLGALLFIGAVWIAGAAAREATLAPDAIPTLREARRGRAVTCIAALLLAAATYGGTARWRIMDREFRNNALAKPRPVQATITNAGPLRLLRLERTADSGELSWNTLVTDHGKLMHLFLVREPDCAAFAHLHPVRRDNRTFENVLPPLPAGSYQLYAEVTHENGLSETLIARLDVPAPSGPELPRSRIGKWSTKSGAAHLAYPWEMPDNRTRSTRTIPGKSVLRWLPRRRRGPKSPRSRTAARWSFTMPEISSKIATLPCVSASSPAKAGEPFCSLTWACPAMPSFAAQTERSSRTFIRSAPSRWPRRNCSRAANAIPASNASHLSSRPKDVTFPYAFPRTGEYRLWVQVRLEGKVQTGVFDVRVAER
jgi:hypothetical protein